MNLVYRESIFPILYMAILYLCLLNYGLPIESKSTLISYQFFSLGSCATT